MGGDAVEPENLIETEPKEILKGSFLGAPLRFAHDEPIQGLLPADDAKDEFLAEAAIDAGEWRFSEGALEEDLGKVAVWTALTQHSGRNFSWFLSAH